MIRVLVVDDHPMMADAWRAAIDAEPDMQVTGVASNLGEAVALVATEGMVPDVAVVDVRLGEESGFRLLERVDLARVAVVMVSANGSPAYVDTAQRRGARGFVLKTSPTSRLVEGVRLVAAGGSAWDPAALMVARERPWRPLSEREHQIVRCMVDGRSNGEIGLDLGIAVKTVETHVANLFKRFGVASRTELVRRALEEGWLDTPPR